MTELEFLKGVPLFKGLSESQIAEVRKLMYEERFPADHVLMEEGRPGDTMYILRRGTVEISKALTVSLGKGDFAQREKTLIKLDSGYLGEMALLENSFRSATVTTLTDSEFYVIRRDDFNNLGESRPEIGYRIMRNIAEELCRRLRRTNQDVLKLTTALSLALGR